MRQHDFYSGKDADAPDAIFDGNGEVVLCLCKVCGQAEIELEPECPGSPQEQDIRAKAQLLLQDAAAAGVVLTIEQRPLKPLAMGNYETIVAVRRARSAA